MPLMKMEAIEVELKDSEDYRFLNDTGNETLFTELELPPLPFCLHLNISNNHAGITIEDVKYVTYGILWPTICAMGIIGNILNLIVLNQSNMKGTAYIYMRGYSSSSLTAIIVAIPFAIRIFLHNEVGQWTNIYQAFFHTHLELYLGNSCLGMGVMMLVSLTLERYMAVCHPEKARALQGARKAYFIIASIPIMTLVIYSPHLFRSQIIQCVNSHGMIIFQKKENHTFLRTNLYLFYKWFIGIVFRLGPTILLAFLNLRIIFAYRKTCANRRRMTGKATPTDKFAEENRIMLLLGSTSVLFFVCVTPMVILSVMISDSLLKSFWFQVFRSVANLLELTNYSLTFYIYCFFSKEFRNTFRSLFQAKNSISIPMPKPTTTPVANASSTPLL